MTDSDDLPEPYQSLLAFLSDIHEQIALERALLTDAACIAVLNRLALYVESAAVVVRQAALAPWPAKTVRPPRNRK